MSRHGTLCAVCFASAFGRWLSKEDDRADQFVGTLLGRGEEQFELLPVVGGGDAVSCGHGQLQRSKLSRDAGTLIMDQHAHHAQCSCRKDECAEHEDEVDAVVGEAGN